MQGSGEKRPEPRHASRGYSEGKRGGSLINMKSLTLRPQHPVRAPASISPTEMSTISIESEREPLLARLEREREWRGGSSRTSDSDDTVVLSESPTSHQALGHLFSSLLVDSIPGAFLISSISAYTNSQPSNTLLCSSKLHPNGFRARRGPPRA